MVAKREPIPSRIIAKYGRARDKKDRPAIAMQATGSTAARFDSAKIFACGSLGSRSGWFRVQRLAPDAFLAFQSRKMQPDRADHEQDR